MTRNRGFGITHPVGHPFPLAAGARDYPLRGSSLSACRGGPCVGEKPPRQASAWLLCFPADSKASFLATKKHKSQPAFADRLLTNAERKGFEPLERQAFNGFRDRPDRPLRHLSNGQKEKRHRRFTWRRQRDSNPRSLSA